MIICMYYSFFGFVWFLFSVIFRVREFKERELLKKETQKLDETLITTEIKPSGSESFIEQIDNILKSGTSNISFAMLYSNRIDIAENLPIDYNNKEASDDSDSEDEKEEKDRSIATRYEQDSECITETKSEGKIQI